MHDAIYHLVGYENTRYGTITVDCAFGNREAHFIRENHYNLQTATECRSADNLLKDSFCRIQHLMYRKYLCDGVRAANKIIMHPSLS